MGSLFASLVEGSKDRNQRTDKSLEDDELESPGRGASKGQSSLEGEPYKSLPKGIRGSMLEVEHEGNHVQSGGVSDSIYP